jgi:hypothetical protein
MRTAPRAKAVGAVQEVLLIHRFQHHEQRPLEHFVLQGGNADGPGLVLRPLLGNVHTSDRRRTIATALEPFEQVAQVLVQPLLVRLGRDAVHSHCAVLARAPVRLFHPHQIDVVRQRQQHHPRRPARQFRDRLLSR